MSSRTETWVAGIVGVAVGAALAVTIFLVSQPPAAREQATGAIGAAERYRGEQIKEGDTGISGSSSATAGLTTAAVAEMLGRAAADRQAEALNKAAHELKDAMWEHATALERYMAFVQADEATQRAVVARVPVAERHVFERAMADRAKQDRAEAEALGRVPVEAWNQAALELKDVMWEHATALERYMTFVQADEATQRAVVARMPEAERHVLERVLADRAFQDRAALRRAVEQ